MLQFRQSIFKWPILSQMTEFAKEMILLFSTVFLFCQSAKAPPRVPRDGISGVVGTAPQPQPSSSRDVPRGHRALRGVIECASSGCLSFTFLNHNGCSCCNVCVGSKMQKRVQKTANFRWHLIISGLAFSSRHLLPSLFYFIHRHLSLSNRTKGPTF